MGLPYNSSARSRLSMAILTPAQKPRGLARIIFTGTSIIRTLLSYRGGIRPPSDGPRIELVRFLEAAPELWKIGRIGSIRLKNAAPKKQHRHLRAGGGDLL